MKILFVVQMIDYIDPIGLMTISAIAKKRGHSTHLTVLTRENILEKIKALRPDVIGYSASTGEHKYYFSVNKVVKSNFDDVFTIMGGPHVTFYPESIENSSLDAICVGEGEGAFAQFLDALEAKKGIENIQNILTHKDKPIVRNLEEDLDAIPFPDRELFYKTTEMGDFPLKSFMASRGCPYPCTYCFNHIFRKIYSGKGKVIRRHSVDYLIEQIEQVKHNYPLKFVKFYDDIFSYKVDDWLEEFIGKYKNKIGLPFLCLTRADLLTEKMVKLLKEAGCHTISMSIEAGNPHFRNDVLKRNMSNEQIIKAFELCHKYNIDTFSNNILGLPFATTKDEIETLDFNLKCKVSFAEFPIFHPYPRTQLGDYCIKKGIYNKNYDEFHMSYMNESPLSCFTKKEKKIQKNISRLGNLVIILPSLRNLVVNYLIYLPYNIFYFLIYYITKAYLNKTKVYPFKMRFKELYRLFIKSIKLEKFKLSKEFRL